MINDEIIQKDKKENPGCFYSEEKSLSCHPSKTGERICETIRQIIRRCPGQPQKRIFFQKEEKKTDHDENINDSYESEFSFHNAPSLSEFFNEFESSFGGHFGQIFEQIPDIFGGGSPFQKKYPGDHEPERRPKRYLGSVPRKKYPLEQRKDIFKDYDGRVDEI